MNKQTTHSSLASSLRLASAASLLIALAGPAAHAQSVLLTAPPPGYFATPTAAYPLNNGFISGPFTVAAGGTNVTFTATNPGTNSFETFDNSVANGAPLDFPVDTYLIDTFDGGGTGSTQSPTGPLLINFSSGVGTFGLNVESSRDDTSTFSFTAYDGSAVIGQYTLPPVTQTEAPGDHHSIFLGAQATDGNVITSVLISSVSLAGGVYTGGNDDFYSGPLSTYSPVPESSTTVSFGLLLALGLGGVLARKKMGTRKASVS